MASYAYMDKSSDKETEIRAGTACNGCWGPNLLLPPEPSKHSVGNEFFIHFNVY